MASFLARRNKKARKLAITAIKPAQLYGHTAVGMSPTSINACKSNIAEATGMAGANACSTPIFAWAFRRSRANAAHADPRVSIPLEEIIAWIGIWGKATSSTKNAISGLWAKVYRRIAKAKTRWLVVRGAISATIATLLDLGFSPVAPTEWVTPDGQHIACFNHEPGVSHYHVLDQIRQMLELKQWKAASDHFNGSGLEKGMPSLAPASRAYNKLVREMAK